MTQPSITCPRCGLTSYHPEDVRQKYCGYCHAYTGLDETRSWYDTHDSITGELIDPPKEDRNDRDR